ncbi:MAG: diacylglycerol kinase family lipid kinase [Betaproteobacteria bacterium]|nr:MAG: diacylglycerol kinase family lipid kinase [Betaproteobacteria bacterium]
MEQRWFAILNPKSGGGRAARDRGRIEKELSHAGVAYDLEVSAHAGHARLLAEQAASRGYRRLLCVGGDGTLNEVLNGALGCGAVEANELTLALIPVGRGNDWARGRGIPRRYATVAGLIANGMTIHHDVGVIEHAADDARQMRHFLNVAGAGFDAHVVSMVESDRWGALTYLAALPAGFASYRCPDLEISSNGETSTGKVFVIFAAIGRYCGGGMSIAPRALPDDGLLDVVVIGDISKWELVLNIRRLFDGSIEKYRKVRTFRTNAVEIAGPVPVTTEVDGELCPPTPARISLLERQIRVVVPDRQ